MTGDSNGTAAGDVEYSSAVEPDTAYYVKVTGGGTYASSRGAYTLTVTQP